MKGFKIFSLFIVILGTFVIAFTSYGECGEGDGTGIIYARPCIIYIAALDSYLEPHIKTLRDFRDRYLIANFKIQISNFKIEIPNIIGKAFVSLYYKGSPPIAEYIRQHETLRTVTRWALTPVVYVIEHTLLMRS